MSKTLQSPNYSLKCIYYIVLLFHTPENYRDEFLEGDSKKLTKEFWTQNHINIMRF